MASPEAPRETPEVPGLWGRDSALVGGVDDDSERQSEKADDQHAIVTPGQSCRTSNRTRCLPRSVTAIRRAPGRSSLAHGSSVSK